MGAFGSLLGDENSLLAGGNSLFGSAELPVPLRENRPADPASRCSD
jgi:hypothetical protein